MVRDVALVAAAKTDAETIRKALSDACGELAVEVTLFDIYTGERMEQDKKSLAFSVQYRSLTKTLTDKEVDVVHNKAVKKVCGDLGLSMR